MKKTIIVTAIIMVVSFIGIICFGVGLGAEGMNEYFKNGTTDFSHEIEKLNERFDDDYDWSAAGKGEYLRETLSADSLDFKESNLKIHADVAKINLTASNDGNIHISADIYSAKENYNKNRYTLSSSDGFDVNLKVDESTASDCIAVLNVSVPVDTVNDITIDSDVGDIGVSGLEINSLTIKAAVGNVVLGNCTVSDTSITVDTGNVEISKTYDYTKSLSASNNVGAISLSLPQGNRGFSASYSTALGALELDENIDKTGFVFTDEEGSNSNSLMSNGTIKYNPSSLSDGELIKIALSASVGAISIDR